MMLFPVLNQRSVPSGGGTNMLRWAGGAERLVSPSEQLITYQLDALKST